MNTDRLTLRPATAEQLTADLDGHAALAKALQARIPGDWPPPMLKPPELKAILEQVRQHPGWPWWIWYIVARGQAPRLIGRTGFRGPPDERGEIEVGFTLVSSERRQGYATEAVRAITEWAFTNPGVRRIAATTYPHIHPAVRLLDRCGFRFEHIDGRTAHMRFVLDRPA